MAKQERQFNMEILTAADLQKKVLVTKNRKRQAYFIGHVAIIEILEHHSGLANSKEEEVMRDNEKIF